MNKDLKEQVSLLLSPNEEQKARILQGIEERCRTAQDFKNGGNRRRKLRPALAAALVICLLLSTTAVAAEYMGLDIGFLNFLKPADEKQEQFLAQGAYTVNQSAACNGGEVIVKQVIGDSNLTDILIDFMPPEGVSFNQARYQFRLWEFDAGQAFSNSDFQTVESNAGDGRISLVLRVMTKEPLAGKTARLKLTDLQAAGPFPGAFQTVASGEWEFSFPLDFQQYSSPHQAAVPVNLLGYPAELQSVSVSPISITLRIQSGFAREISQEKQALGEEVGPNQFVDNYPVTIHYQDGSSETTELFDGLYQADYHTGEILLIKTFENVINEKALTSIEFFGVEIPIVET